MNDIISDLCNLPTGAFSIEFIPRHEISSWNGDYPVPVSRWYGIGAYRNSLSYSQTTQDSNQGNLTPVSVGCLIVNDSQVVADQLEAMGQMRFVLRIGHYDGKYRIVGTPDEFVKLDTSNYAPEEIVGVQGYKLNFTGSFVRRPVVISGI